ncbi:MAG: transporter related protein [Bacillales bacterium]|jgi:branched-chain amino acid transport system ATP-binding protein|nr:transporter related protein [Bacillales bacterium]
MTKLLDVKNLSVSFGGLKAVNQFEIQIGSQELVGLIGPNGAGKTTVFNLLTGVYTPTEGSILLDGNSLIGKGSNKIVNMGVARTFQNIRLFKNLSVIDNVKIAFQSQMKYSALAAVLRLPSYWKEEKLFEEKALDLLKIFKLENFAYQKACNLPYGEQRKLEIARALATEPKLLLLDEPAAGMNPSETNELMETIRLVKEKFEIAILLIEHDMSLVMGICEKVAVLEYGSIIASGSPEQIQNDPRVIASYLGESD